MVRRRSEQMPGTDIGDASLYFAIEQALRQLSNPTIVESAPPSYEYVSLLLGNHTQILELLQQEGPEAMVVFLAALAQTIAAIPRRQFQNLTQVTPPLRLERLLIALNLTPASFSTQLIPQNPIESQNDGRITPAQRAALLRLTARERLILRLMGQGESKQKIAQAVDLGANFLNVQIRSIPNKLAVPDITAAVVLFDRSGL